MNKINPRSSRRRLAAGVLFSALVIGPAAAAPRAERPLNVLLITIDTLRPDRLSCYDSQSPRTPSIDALAGRGARFRRAFAHNTVTLPSHANILLGLTPSAHGVHDNSNFIVADSFLTLAEFLKGAGYATSAFVGAFPLDSRFGLTQGFDIYDDNYGTQEPGAEVFVERPADRVVDRALAWLETAPSPWFAWVHLFDCHQPYHPPEPFRTRFKDDPYAGEVAFVDQEVGRLLAALKVRGLEAGTGVILTADHGESLGEHGEATHGYFAYNATLWVPLLVALPGAEPVELTANAGHIDIFPTICGALGLDPPAGLQGRSLLPLLRGGRLPEKEIYFEALTAYCNRGWAPLRGFISGPTKFIDSPVPEIYDLEADFGELKNIAGGADIAALRRRFGELFAGLGAPAGAAARRLPDMETREKLRALGYLASPQAPPAGDFGPEDDLKTLLPFHNKWMRATAARQSGRIDRGMALLREIIAERPDFDLAHTYLADYLKAAGRKEEALAVLDRAWDRNPASVRIIAARGVALLEAGRFDEAAAAFEHGLELVDFDPELWNYLGVAHWNKGRFREAEKCYQRALALDENYAVVHNNCGSLYLSEHLASKNPAALTGAEGAFREAVRLDPAYASAWNGLGTALKMRGDFAGAIAAWERAVGLKPDFGYPLYNLGLVHLSRGDKAKALEYFLRYKKKEFDALPAAERTKLDSLIEDCRRPGGGGHP